MSDCTNLYDILKLFYQVAISKFLLQVPKSYDVEVLPAVPTFETGLYFLYHIYNCFYARLHPPHINPHCAPLQILVFLQSV